MTDHLNISIFFREVLPSGLRIRVDINRIRFSIIIRIRIRPAKKSFLFCSIFEILLFCGFSDFLKFPLKIREWFLEAKLLYGRGCSQTHSLNNILLFPYIIWRTDIELSFCHINVSMLIVSGVNICLITYNLFAAFLIKFEI